MTGHAVAVLVFTEPFFSCFAELKHQHGSGDSTGPVRPGSRVRVDRV